MTGGGESRKRTLDGSDDEAVELGNLCLVVMHDRKTVGDDRMQFRLDQIADDRKGWMLTFSNDAGDAEGSKTNLGQNIFEVRVPVTMAVKHDTKIPSRRGDGKRLTGEGEGEAGGDGVMVFAVASLTVAEEDNTTLFHIEQHPPICCPFRQTFEAIVELNFSN